MPYCDECSKKCSKGNYKIIQEKYKEIDRSYPAICYITNPLPDHMYITKVKRIAKCKVCVNYKAQYNNVLNELINPNLEMLHKKVIASLYDESEFHLFFYNSYWMHKYVVDATHNVKTLYGENVNKRLLNYNRIKPSYNNYLNLARNGIEIMNNLTVEGLKIACKNNNLKGFSKMRRSELVRLLMSI